MTYSDGFHENRFDSPVLLVSAADLEDAFRTIVGEILRQRESEARECRLPRKEVVRRLKVDPSTLWRWDKEGYLKTVHQGRKVFYRESDVLELENGMYTH